MTAGADRPASSARLRVLFLNPPDLQGGVWMKEVGRCGRRAVAGEVWPQTGLAMLAAAVEQAGHEARIIDGMAEPAPLEQMEAECRRKPPHLIVSSSATPTFRNDAAYTERLALAGGSAWGFAGPHVSALPRESLLETSADFALINEAEETVAELVRRLAGRDLRALPGDPAARRAGLLEALANVMPNVRGVAWKRPAQADAAPEIVANAPRSLVQSLDDLPLPARHLLPNHAYRMPFFDDHPFATVIPARGCPWPCTFCRAGRVWGRRVRLRSPESVLGEIRSLERDFGIRHVVFMTDSLTLRRDWTMQLLAGLETMDRPPAWICNSRVDVVDAEMLALMKRAGCRMISYGLESGSQEILDRCGKKITLEQSERAIRLTREAGLPSMAYFILGLPGETRETVRQTIRFARRVAPDYVNFHIATPFPGTALYEEARERGWLRSDDWSDYEEEGSAVLEAGELTTDELEKAQRRAMLGFYLRPARILKELARLRRWSELKSRARAALRMLGVLGSP